MLSSSNAAFGVAPEDSVQPSQLESMVDIPSSPAASHSKLNYPSADENMHTPKNMKPPSVSHNILEVQGREQKDVFKIKEKYN